MSRVCLVGATHPCYNPRLVREADALARAGYEVRVVAPSYNPTLVEKDRALMANRPWRLELVDFVSENGRLRSLWIRGRRKLAQEMARGFATASLAEHSYTPALAEMRRLATREPADWFIAHTQAALPVAATAAGCWDARLGFDCEDLLAHAPGEPSAVLRKIEAGYLPRCAYVTAASPLMAEQLARDHHLSPPLVLYNVFPLELAQGMRPPAERPPASVLRLHWFGQTIGPGRGLEDAVAALAHLSGVELHLRGNPSWGYREKLENLAGGARRRLFFRPPLDHDEVIRAMELFDVGLALERPDHGNYSRTVTNKLFSYLLAGLAIAASDTPGQREVMSQISSAGFLYPAGDSRALAAGLLNWARDRQSLRVAQQASWNAARTRFCWDHERRKFLALFEVPECRELVPAVESVVS